jgi:hypothetical protein
MTSRQDNAPPACAGGTADNDWNSPHRADAPQGTRQPARAADGFGRSIASEIAE